jgi:Sec-independent protein translocase protein TatA
MQMFGVGVYELAVILLLAAIVIGPDRLPAFAADLARWIRQARAYAQHLTKDFNEVISDIESQSGTTREDWKEIASVVGYHASSVTREFQNVAQVARNVNLEGDLQPAAQQPDNVVPFDGGATAQDSTAAAAVEAGEAAEAEPQEEKPWYVPERTTRRRSSE